jgi:hypothetical protein
MQKMSRFSSDSLKVTAYQKPNRHKNRGGDRKRLPSTEDYKIVRTADA